MRRRIFRRRYNARRNRRSRIPASFARNELYTVRPGRQLRTINPGDAWVKRRLCRQVNVVASGFVNFTLADLWNAIVCGPTASGTSAVNQPFSSSSQFDVRVKAVYIYCYRAVPFECRINEATFEQSSGGSNLKSIFAYPTGTTAFTKMAFKIPTPQQVVIPGITASSSTTMFSLLTPGLNDGTSFFVNLSLKYKI